MTGGGRGRQRERDSETKQKKKNNPPCDVSGTLYTHIVHILCTSMGERDDRPGPNTHQGKSTKQKDRNTLGWVLVSLFNQCTRTLQRMTRHPPLFLDESPTKQSDQMVTSRPVILQRTMYCTEYGSTGYTSTITTILYDVHT